VEKTPVAMDPAALCDAPGRYQGLLEGEPFFYTVEAKDGALSIHASNWPAPRVLFPASTTEMRFFIRETEREYTFERDGSGRVVRIRVTGAGSPEIVTERIG
jgi:hypothetical protein